MPWSRLEWGMLVATVLGIWAALAVDFAPSWFLVFLSAVLAVPAALWAVRQRKPAEVRRSPMLGVVRRQVPAWIVFLVALPIAWLFMVYAGGMVLARAVSSEHLRAGIVEFSEVPEQRGRSARYRQRCAMLQVRLQTDQGQQHIVYCDVYYGRSPPPPGLSLTYRTHESPLGLFYAMTSRVQAQGYPPTWPEVAR